MYPQKKNQRYSFPYEIANVDQELNAQLLKDFTGERTGFVQVGPKKWFFPSGYAKDAENIYNFEFRQDDVVIMGFPRSGTTLTQEMIWLLCNDLNYKKASEITLSQRVPCLETRIVIHDEVKEEVLAENKNILTSEQYEKLKLMNYPLWERLANSNERRFIKTHLPCSLLSPSLTKVGCKRIYVMRNPKDVVVSCYHLNKALRNQGFTGDFKKYWNYFKKDLVSWTPYWEHVKQGWNMRNEENVLVLSYEDMVTDTRGAIEKTANFLEVSCHQDNLEALIDYLKFDSFKNNKAINQENAKVYRNNEVTFIRKGKVGGWKEYFEEETDNEADEWIEMNIKETDFKVPE